MTDKPLPYLGDKRRTRLVYCSSCGAQLDGASGFNNNETPTPGMFSVCVYCGNLSVFADDLKLRPPTEAEMLEAAGDPDILKMQQLRAMLGQIYPPKGEQDD